MAHHGEHQAHAHDRFSAEAAGWDDKPGHAERAVEVAAAIREALDLGPQLTAIEIGGGTGLLARALADDLGAVTVTDVAPGMVAAAAAALDDPKYAGWRAEHYDIEHDPLPSERYDVVLALLTLHHMGDVATVIRRTAELLRPGGQVAIVDLDHDPSGAFHSGVDDFDGHDGFTREQVEQWLQQAGFAQVKVDQAGTVLKEIDGAPQEFGMFLASGRLPD